MGLQGSSLLAVCGLILSGRDRKQGDHLGVRWRRGEEVRDVMEGCLQAPGTDWMWVVGLGEELVTLWRLCPRSAMGPG